MLGCKCSVAEGRRLYSYALKQNCSSRFPFILIQIILPPHTLVLRLMKKTYLPERESEPILVPYISLHICSHNKNSWACSKQVEELKISGKAVNIKPFELRQQLCETRAWCWLLALTPHTKAFLTSIPQIPSTGSRFFHRSNYIQNEITAKRDREI